MKFLARHSMGAGVLDRALREPSGCKTSLRTTQRPCRKMATVARLERTAGWSSGGVRVYSMTSSSNSISAADEMGMGERRKSNCNRGQIQTGRNERGNSARGGVLWEGVLHGPTPLHDRPHALIYVRAERGRPSCIPGVSGWPGRREGWTRWTYGTRAARAARYCSREARGGSSEAAVSGLAKRRCLSMRVSSWDEPRDAQLI